MHGPHLLLGSILSPFAVKLRLLCTHTGLLVKWLPEEGTTWLNLRVQARRLALVTRLQRLTHPPLSELDELPLVPFLFGPHGESYYDSSAIGRFLHENPPARAAVPLLPAAPLPRFLCSLIDEAFDELGLYLLHHQRWVRGARSTRAPEIAGREFAALVPTPLRAAAQRRFAARQVRRLPYLFSVAPVGLRIEGAPAHRQPPSRPGFPPTHALLDDLFVRWLGALEHALSASPFLLGEALTLADAAAYGMIASHLAVDPETAAWIERQAPSVARWARALPEGAARPAGAASAATSAGAVPESVRPLLQAIGESFLPLMLQNEAAYERLRTSGQRRFNEPAFNEGQALYDGALAGHPYRSVAKSFQVKVTRSLRRELRALDAASRKAAQDLVPGLAALITG